MVAKSIIKFRWLLITIIGIATALAIWLLPQLTTDTDFSNFFPKGDKEILAYESFKERLGSNDHFIAVAILPRKAMFDQGFLHRVEQFRKECNQIQDIESATAITNLSRYDKTPFGMISRPYIHLGDEEKLQQDSSIIFSHIEFTQQYISRDASSLLVILKLKESLSMAKNDTVVSQVERIINDYAFHDTHIMGKKLIEVHYKRLMSSEMSKSILLSFGLIILLLILFYKSVKEIILPLMTMIVALLVFYGFLSFTGRSLGIMSSLYPTIILIVGISDAIHIMTKYNLEINKGASSSTAIKKVINEVGLSILLTSLTTVVGFLTLTYSVMPALQDFGIDASIGIILAFLISILLLPAILLVLPSRKSIKIKGMWFDWVKISESIFKLINTTKPWILGITIISIALSCFGIYKIDTNNLQMANIPKSHSLKKDYSFFDQNIGGARAFEISIEIKDSSTINQKQNLHDIGKLHDYILSNTTVQYLISPISYYHWISKIYDRSLEPLEISSSNNNLIEYEKGLSKYLKNSTWKIVDDSKKYGRFTGRLQDIGRLEVKDLNHQVKQWIDQEIDTSRIAFHFVGMDLLVDKGHEHRINNMIWGILIALLAIAILIGFLFQRWSTVIITLIANVIPLILIAGLMGFFGIELRGTTSIIFAVGFVIAVDDTIHFLSKYQIELKKGFSVNESIRTTLSEAGKAIFTTSMILFGGFLVLLHSSFGDIYSVGFMVSIMIIISLLLDLFLVPVLLQMMTKKDKDE